MLLSLLNGDDTLDIQMQMKLIQRSQRDTTAQVDLAYRNGSMGELRVGGLKCAPDVKRAQTRSDKHERRWRECCLPERCGIAPDFIVVLFKHPLDIELLTLRLTESKETLKSVTTATFKRISKTRLEVSSAL